MEGQYYEPGFTVMKMSGQAAKFMEGISSNTATAPRNAFLDVHGKIVTAFFQKQTESGTLMAFPAQFRQRMETHLARYLAISKARLEPTALHAYFTTSTEPQSQEGSHTIVFPGKFGIFLAELPPHGLKRMSQGEFECWRIENGVSLQGKEFDFEMVMNTDWKDAVSSTKGCFLGQEIVVKVTQRGKPPKRLARIAFGPEPQKIMRGGVEVGEVRSKCFSRKLGKWVAYCSLPNDGLGVDGGEMIP